MDASKEKRAVTSTRTKPILGIAAGAGLMLLCPAAAIWRYLVEMRHRPPHGASAAEYSEKVYAHLNALVYTGTAGVVGFLIGLALFTISIVLFVRANATPSASPANPSSSAWITSTIVTAVAAAFGIIIIVVLFVARTAVAPLSEHGLKSTVLVPDDSQLPTVTLTLHADGSLTSDNVPVPRASLEGLLKSKSAKRVIVHVASGANYDQRTAFLHELEDDGIDKIYFQEESK